MAKLNSAKLSQQIIPTFPPFLHILSACVDWCSSNGSTSCFSSLPWHHLLCLPLCAARLLHYLCDLPIVLSKLAVLCPQQIAHLQRYTIGLIRAPTPSCSVFGGWTTSPKINNISMVATNLHKAAICGLK